MREAPARVRQAYVILSRGPGPDPIAIGEVD